MLCHLEHPAHPEPLGVIYADTTKPSHGSQIHEQLESQLARPESGDLQAMINGRSTWEIHE